MQIYMLPENYKEIIEYIRVAIGCKKEIILLNDVKTETI